MTKRKRGLGNLGVDVLLSAVSAPNEPVRDGELRTLAIDLIERGRYQPRTRIEPEALEELAASIRAQGLVQPVVVRPSNGRYELIAGERRWRAAQLAELREIPAVVKDIPDQAAAAMALIENIQRQDLNSLEEAAAFQRLIEEFELTHQQVADAVGRSRAAVSNMLRLLERGAVARAGVEQRELEMGHARALLALDGAAQDGAARTVVSKGWSVRDTERYVKSLLRKASHPVEVRHRDPDVARLERTVSEKVGVPVEISHNRKGKGTLVIRYSSLDELDGVLEHIR